MMVYNPFHTIKLYKNLESDILVTFKMIEDGYKLYQSNSLKNDKFMFHVPFNVHTRFKVELDVNCNQFHVYAHVDSLDENEILRRYRKINAEPKQFRKYWNNCIDIQHHFRVSERNCKRIYDMFILVLSIYEEAKPIS